MGSSQEAITVGRWTGDFIVPTCVISQPRFFPGLHYLHRMMVTDVFVVLDTVQFTPRRSEEHTSELQSQSNLVCRLLLEKKTQQRSADLSRSVRAASSTDCLCSHRLQAQYRVPH